MEFRRVLFRSGCPLGDGQNRAVALLVKLEERELVRLLVVPGRTELNTRRVAENDRYHFLGATEIGEAEMNRVCPRGELAGGKGAVLKLRFCRVIELERL